MSFDMSMWKNVRKITQLYYNKTENTVFSLKATKKNDEFEIKCHIYQKFDKSKMENWTNAIRTQRRAKYVEKVISNISVVFHPWKYNNCPGQIVTSSQLLSDNTQIS